MESTPTSPPSASNQCGDIHNDLLTSVTKNHSLDQTSDGEPNQKNNLVGDPTKSTSWHEKVAGDQGILRHQGEMVIQPLSHSLNVNHHCQLTQFISIHIFSQYTYTQK